MGSVVFEGIIDLLVLTVVNHLYSCEEVVLFREVRLVNFLFEKITNDGSQLVLSFGELLTEL